MSAQRRRFTAARNAERCTADIVLRDKSGAQCMRRATEGTLCTQHARIAERLTGVPRWDAINVLLMWYFGTNDADLLKTIWEETAQNTSTLLLDSLKTQITETEVALHDARVCAADEHVAYEELRTAVQRVLSLQSFDPRDVTEEGERLKELGAKHQRDLEEAEKRLAELVEDDPDGGD